jgi:hypothetical protein
MTSHETKNVIGIVGCAGARARAFFQQIKIIKIKIKTNTAGILMLTIAIV